MDNDAMIMIMDYKDYKVINIWQFIKFWPNDPIF